MSRFNTTRWGRILAWTGAGLAWGGALTAGELEPLRAQPETVTEPSGIVEVDLGEQAPMPAQPAKGLIILRYPSAGSPEPEVQTVYVRQRSRATAPASKTAPANSKPAPSSSGPAPRSSGS